MATLNFEYYNNSDLYNDGVIEEELLNHYKYGDQIDKDRSDVFFATTKIRENILNWYPFSQNSTILEIGAGMGSITGCLLKNAKKVISVENAKRRAEVLYNRHKDAANLEIYCGNFQDIKFQEKFDYIILIGVFEYAQTFYNTENSFEDFIKDIKKLLSKDGKILLGIENKFGLKYWAGISEDHLKEPYSGIENYHNTNKVRTFSKKELITMFEKYNLYCNFYNVYPDYKLPNLIYNEKYNISNNEIINYKDFNYYNDYKTFDDKKVLTSLNESEMANDFANSFLIEIARNKKDFEKINYVKFQNERADEYQVGTVVSNEYIKKIPLNKKAEDHLNKLEFLHKKLNENNIPACNIKKNGTEFLIEIIEGENLLRKMEFACIKKDNKQFEKLMDDFVNWVYKKSKVVKTKNLLHKSLEFFGEEIRVLPYALLDLHADNIIIKDGNFILIDQEWWDDRQLPIEYNIFVNINVVYDKIPSCEELISKKYFFMKYGFTDEILDILGKVGNEWFLNYKRFINDDSLKIINDGGKFKKSSDIFKELNTEIFNLTKKIKELELVKKEIEMQKTIENEQIKKELIFFKGIIEDYKEEKENLIKNNNYYQFLINNANASLAEKDKQMYDINMFYNHKIYRISTRIINFIYKIIPINSFRRRVLSYIKRLIKKIMSIIKKITRFILKGIYRSIPSKNIKRKIILKLKNSRRLSKILSLPYFPNLPKRNLIANGETYTLNNIQYIDKTIAVHLHLFYPDLAQEFYNYFLNIPYKFDLYISVPQNTKIHKLKRLFNKNINIEKLVIKVSENSGRDYGPMYVLFKNDLKKYDYILHVHSKKSLRTGNEQTEWRQYLLNNLLGSKEMVMQYFDLMENWNVGIAYPNLFVDLVYWCCSHLGSAPLAIEYYKKLGLKFEDTYMNFSGGSMFWCKRELIEDLFELDLEWSDFGKEKGQKDGTLEYVMERIYDPLCKKKGLNYASFNSKDNNFYLNYCDKNLIQYTSKTKEGLLGLLMNFPIITFDIFDTLITRKVYEPINVFELIDEKVTQKFNFQPNTFITERKKAEEDVRKNKNYLGDCNINEIYEQMLKNTKFSSDIINEIKELEIETDINCLIPRKDMLEIYNELLKNNKQIVLVSDMYYTKPIIEKILYNCGYYNYFDILISSEIGFRKDNGTMWDYVFEKYNNSIHIGDNEQSDIHILISRNKPCDHIMSGKKMYEISNYYNSTNNLIENKIMRGLIVNKALLNSPFALNEKSQVDLFNYGYAIFGPIFLYFFIWLINNIDDDNELLFVSREGHYLQKIYQEIIKRSNKEFKNSYRYFLTSRRAVTVANIKNIEDISNIFKINYNGNLKELFYYRLELMLDESIENETIALPRDYEKVMKIAADNLDMILNKAKEERSNYLKYIDNNLDMNKKPIVIDLGYSGSVQYELSKLLDKKINGAYFIVSNNLKPLSIGAKVLSCYNSIVYDNSFLENPIGKYQLFLEAFLTGPDGQLFNFDENGNPIFLEERNKENYMKQLDKIYEGIIEFIKDMDEMNTVDIVDLKLDKDYILNNFELFIKNNKNQKIVKMLKVEDLYSSNKQLNACDYNL